MKTKPKCRDQSCDDLISSSETLDVHFITGQHPSEHNGFMLIITVVQNYCEPFTPEWALVLYNEERLDGNLQLGSKATVTCTSTCKISGTIQDNVYTRTCLNDTTWSKGDQVCIQTCRVNLVERDVKSGFDLCKLDSNDALMLEDKHKTIMKHYNRNGKQTSQSSFVCINSTWSPAAPPQACHSSLSGVLVIGGLDESNAPLSVAMKTIEIFSPLEGESRFMPFELPTGVYDHISVMLSDRKVLVLGGLTKSYTDSIPVNQAYYIDIFTQQIQSASSPQFNRVSGTVGNIFYYVYV